MWSLGCILGEMLLDKPIFPGPSSIQQLQLISQTLPAPTRDGLFIFAFDEIGMVNNLCTRI
jgi:mitogen-activated protein kinase 15